MSDAVLTVEDPKAPSCQALPMTQPRRRLACKCAKENERAAFSKVRLAMSASWACFSQVPVLRRERMFAIGTDDRHLE